MYYVDEKIYKKIFLYNKKDYLRVNLIPYSYEQKGFN